MERVDPFPDDDKCRSSRNIAITLFRQYKTAVERGGSENLKEFISSGVNSYALDCTSEVLRDELADLKESGDEIKAMQISGGKTSVKAKMFSKENYECILWLSIVFITILCTPQPTVNRWSSMPPVSGELLVKWKGFWGIIANGVITSRECMAPSENASTGANGVNEMLRGGLGCCQPNEAGV